MTVEGKEKTFLTDIRYRNKLVKQEKPVARVTCKL